LKVGGYVGRNKGEDYEEVENSCNAKRVKSDGKQGLRL